MIYAVVAVIAIIFVLLLYGALMLFTDYINVTLYIKFLFLNFVWFMVSTGYKEYDIYYPNVFNQKWFNFIFISAGFLLLAFELNKLVKLRNALIISTGAVTHLIIALMVLNFCGGLPGWAATVYLTITSVIVIGIHLSAIYGGKNSAPSGFMSRFLAGLLMMPGPFIITSTGLFIMSSDNKHVIDVMPFNEFIERVYDFVKNPDFNYSGKLMFTGMKYERSMFISSLIVAILAFILYIVIDSTIDYRSELKERSKHRKEAEKERVRAEISSRIHSQLEKIDSCVAYISSNYKTLRVRDEDMKAIRTFYDEATRIKYSYNGDANGPTLKRVTELKTEIFILRDKILNDHYGKPEQEQYHSSETVNEEPKKNTEEKKENLKSTGYFNGCKSEEEIKKRYRDLCKVFHPDSENGDQETFLRIKEDYETIMGKTESEAV
ncbi:MAG: J domain-containing protein [Lachnospiraceae bacterium]|nr:J domain-containing protein [Lachnospiraceae bacterium]